MVVGCFHLKMPACAAEKCNNRPRSGSGKSFHKFPFSQPEILKQWVMNINKGESWAPTKQTVICSDHFEEKWFDRTGQTVRLRKGAIPTLFYVSSNQRLPRMIVEKDTSLLQISKVHSVTNLEESDPAFSSQNVENDPSLPCISNLHSLANLEDPEAAFRPQVVEQEASLPYIYVLHSLTNLEAPAFDPQIVEKDASLSHVCVPHSQTNLDELEPAASPQGSSQDHNYSTSPSELKRRLDNEHDKNEMLRKKLKTLRKHTSRMKMKVLSMKKVIRNLKDKNLISDSVSKVLLQNFRNSVEKI